MRSRQGRENRLQEGLSDDVVAEHGAVVEGRREEALVGHGHVAV
jgi:hypothetical protein